MSHQTCCLPGALIMNVLAQKSSLRCQPLTLIYVKEWATMMHLSKWPTVVLTF